MYSSLDVHDGGCREVAILDGLDEREHGFVITGEYDKWKKLVEGEGGVINVLVSGELAVDGDVQRILRYTEAAVDLADTSASLDSRFVV
ncbi:SCP2 sterol-binding domain-containing protein [Halomarina halobia]|uniref:SCP2 sterol-binding domain-containing protein n=1 Tax=Halomarina halobia TaxID=3033386 RepID=A0ABD6A5L6_9EURY|nr:SCP2 sterol-binding domain-containing protein [Halomarina sp. PSR21]